MASKTSSDGRSDREKRQDRIDSIADSLLAGIDKLNFSFGKKDKSGGIVHSRPNPPPRPPPPSPSRPASVQWQQSRPSPVQAQPSNPFRESVDTKPFRACSSTGNRNIGGEARSQSTLNPFNPPPLPPKPNSMRVPVPVPAPRKLLPRQASASGSAAACLICRDFSTVDAHAANFPRQSVHSIPTLATSLTSPFPARTDKARAIFTWLHHNIAYDTAAFFGGNVRHKTPEQTLRSGLAVCQGYAELFAELGRYAGLECKVVSGHGKGYGYKAPPKGTRSAPPLNVSGHAWNAVRLDQGEWHLIDCCWGAGYVNGTAYHKKFKPDYFTDSPEKFRRKHFPKNAADQHCSTSLTWHDYIFVPATAPEIYSDFRELGFSDDNIQPASDTIPACSTWIRFELHTKCEHFSIPAKDQFVLVLYIGDKEAGIFEVDATNRKWTCEARTNGFQLLQRGAKVNVFAVDTLNGVSAKGVGVQEFNRRKARGTAWNMKGLCSWKVE